jgi:hypothetical protein
MKARDQAESEKKAAAALTGMTSRVAKFVKWRTETAQGKAHDLYPEKAFVIAVPRTSDHYYNAPVKHLGHTNRNTLAATVRRCLDNPTMYSDLALKFSPDSTMASTQLYQYAPIKGSGPVMLRKTSDVDATRIFRVCGMLKWGYEYYIQPDRLPHFAAPHRMRPAPMGGNVYYSLPVEWKDFEQWKGFGITGNPKNSTYMETLFKIVDSNIEELTFVSNKKTYRVGYTAGRAKSFDNVFSGIPPKKTAAAAAALLAEEDKRARAQLARAREMRRLQQRVTHNLPKKVTFADPPDTSKSRMKKKLTEKLVNGEITEETFKLAMSALD